MKLRPRLLAVCFLALALGLAHATAAGGDVNERRRVAALLTFGEAEAGETGSAETRPARALADEVAEFTKRLSGNVDLRRRTAGKAFSDVYGRVPSESELNAALATEVTYAGWTARFHGQLRGDAHAYHEVLRRAYRFALSREPYDIELVYWQKQDVLPYALVLASLDHWARRNQPGLMVTSGAVIISANCDHLQTAALTRALANEVRALLGSAKLDPDYATEANGRTLLGWGEAGVIVDGHRHVVAAGAPGIAGQSR